MVVVRASDRKELDLAGKVDREESQRERGGDVEVWEGRTYLS